MKPCSQVVDASGTTRTRTITAVFDNSGYSTRTVAEQVTGGVGTAVTAGSLGYDPTTGLATSISDGTNTSTTSYDDFGRVTTYTDAAQATGDARNVVTTTYDTAGRVATVTDAKGSITNTYNQNGDSRDNVTSLTVSGITGTFTGRYDADGRLVEQTWPNGLTQDLTYDEDGEELNRRQVLGSTWLEETTTTNVHGQWRTQTSTGASVEREQTYSYDALGRLTWTRDNGSGECLHRNYRLDANSNRTQRIVYGPTTDGSCQSTTAQSTTSYSYDSADRLQASGTHAGLAYDAYGRITTLPAADTSAGTGAVTIGYYTTDLVRSLTQDGTTLAYGLDAPGRFKTWTNSTSGVTKTNHYGDSSSDSPDWISDSTDGTGWTRNITDLTGNLAATIDHTGKITWQTVNQHGDVTATTTGAAATPDANYATDEFGVPIGTTPNRYGWLGGKQRSSETLGGLTLMGVRLYSPQLGRFLQVDPVAGGSANAYDYANADPVNTFDLDGRCPWCAAVAGAAGACIRFCRYGWRAAKFGWKHRKKLARAAKWGWRTGKRAWKKSGYYRLYRKFATPDSGASAPRRLVALPVTCTIRANTVAVCTGTG